MIAFVYINSTVLTSMPSCQMIILYRAVNIFTVFVLFIHSIQYNFAFTDFRSKEQMTLIRSQNALWQRMDISEMNMYLTL
jgi:hypothetical protein